MISRKIVELWLTDLEIEISNCIFKKRLGMNVDGELSMLFERKEHLKDMLIYCIKSEN